MKWLPRGSGYRRALLAILILGAVLRVGIHLDFGANDPLFDTPTHDSKIFLEWAGRIADGDLLGDRPFFLNPLYPYFIAPLVAVAGPKPLLLIRLVQMLLGLATVLLTASAARRLLGDGPALVAAGLMAVYPVLLFYEQTVMIVTLAVFLNALTLHLLARFAEVRTVRAVLLAGLALGFAVLARPNVGLFAVLLPLWFLTLAEPGRRLRFAAGRGLVLAAGVAAIILPVAVRNYVVGKDLVLVTSSMGFNLYQSNNADAREGGRMDSGDLFFSPGGLEESTRRVAEEAEGRELSPSQVSSWWQERALSEFRANPGPAFGFVGRKLLLFLQSPEYPSSYHFGAQRDLSLLLPWLPLSFGLLSPFAVVGIVVLLRRRTGVLPFAVLFLVYAVGLAVFFPLGHYRAPVLPAAAVLASAGFLALLRPVRQKDWRTAGAVGALFLISLAVTRLPTLFEAAGGDWPAGYEEADRYYPWNRGSVLTTHGHYERAEEWFALARERGDPRWATGLARLEVERGAPLKAAEYFHHVLRLSPDRAGSASDHAVDLCRGGHGREGLALAEAAVRTQPENQFAHANLGEILNSLGRHADALRAHETSERLGAPLWAVARQSYSLRLLGRHGEARRRLEVALAEDRENGILNLELALCLHHLEPEDTGAIRLAVRKAVAAGLSIPLELEPYR